MRSLWAGLLLGASLMLPASALDLQGHRGARGLMPENSLAGFAKALEIGVTTLELDIAITRDGVPVISHDPALNPDITRGPDGNFLSVPGPAIVTLSWDELQRYDVGRLKPGSQYGAPFAQQQAQDGTRIPRLADLFALVRRSGNEAVRFAIETKVFPVEPALTLPPEEFARKLIATVRAAGMERRTAIISFDWRTLQVVQREAPEIATTYITIQTRNFDNIRADNLLASPWTAGLRYRDHGSVPAMIKAAGGRSWSSFHGDLTPAKVKLAHELGITVLAWTVNEPEQIARVLDLGVDGIISDFPDRVRAEMERRGLPLPAATPVKP